MIKIGLDLDDTCNYWYNVYVELFGPNRSNEQITRDVRKLRLNKEFWTSLPVKCRPEGFNPTLYCTKRINPKSYTKQWLEENNFPMAPIYQMLYLYGNKADIIKGRIDVFVDDSISNMVQMNLSGVPCLLMDSESNQDWGPVGRVYSLDIYEIEDAYHLLLDTVFNNFKEYIYA